MHFFIIEIMPWLLSAVTIWRTILTGNLHAYAWGLGIINQVFWFIWIIYTETWGFMPMCIMLTLVYFRNHFKWKKLIFSNGNIMRRFISTENAVQDQKIFLGGTCNDDPWRDQLIPLLSMPYFNPVVKEWTDAAKEQEEEEKQKANIHLYVITPKQSGWFSFIEMAISVFDNKKTVIAFLMNKEHHFSNDQLASIKAIQEIFSEKENVSVLIIDNLLEVASLINQKY